MSDRAANDNPVVNQARAAAGEAPYLVTDALRQRLDLAHHLIGFGRQILVVGGARESGRSAFLAQVIAEAAPEWLIIACDGASVATRVDLLRAVIDVLDPQAAGEEPAYFEGDPGGLRAIVRGRLNLLHAERRRAVLVCDDCDDWTQDHAELLAELAYRHDEVGELRPLVACDQAGPFAEILAASTNTNLPQVIDVPPLTRAEATALLELHRASGDLAADLNDEAFDACYERAGGSAGALLREFADHHPAHPATGGSRLRATAGVAVVVLAAIGLLAIAWFDQRRASPALELIELDVPEKTAPATTAPPTTAPVAPAEPVQSPVTTTVPAPPVARKPVSPALEMVPAGDRSPPQQASPVAETQAKPTPASPPATTTVAPLPAQATTDVQAEDTPVAPEQRAYTRKWVLTHSDTHYVIQLFGSRERAAAARFIAAHGLNDKATVFELRHEEAPWFIAVTGVFPHREAARAAVAELPGALAAAGAWPRTVASLRQ